VIKFVEVQRAFVSAITKGWLVKAALAGCGVALPLHAVGLSQVARAEIVAACDLDRGKAESAAARYSIPRVYTDFDEMLAKERPDVVHVMTPPATHCDLTVKALEAGCHVLVEKPMALTVAACDAMIEASGRCERTLCVMHNHLFDPNVRRFLDRSAVENAVGPLRSVQITYCLDAEKMCAEGHDDPAHWVHQMPLGTLSEQVPHLLYLALNWTGKVSAASVEILEQSGPLPPPHRVYHVRLVGDGALGALVMIDQTEIGEFRIDLHGLRGIVRMNMMDLTAIVEKEPKIERRLNKMVSSCWLGARMIGANAVNALRIAVGRLRPRPGHRRLVRAFYEALASGGEPPVSGEAGREVVRVLELLSASYTGPERAIDLRSETSPGSLTDI